MVSWKTHSDVWAHITLRLFSGFSKIPSSVFFLLACFHMHLLHLPSNHYHLLFLPACNSLSGCGQFAVLHFSPLYHLLCPIFLPSLHLKSSQFMQPKITTLPQRALQSVQHTTLSKQCLMTHTSILVYLQKFFLAVKQCQLTADAFLGGTNKRQR